MAACINKNQEAFKHSARSRALNASLDALFVGVPGRVKSSSTSFQYAH